ncbi:MAG: penicillin-binding protein 1A [Xanthomonadaceae bacterium]|nr:penicillin-binding protein 1A [Xanthomonadaceae bacterium]
MRIFRRLLRWFLILCVLGVVVGALGIGIAYWLIEPRLPSVDVLKDVRLQVPLRVYTKDGKLIATIGETRRIPVKIEDVPQQLKNAFLAAEDANFYNHSGIDFTGILRAFGYMIVKRSLHVPGGSTITQQVARGFFLSPEVSLTRKATEIFLSFRIEHELTKDEIFQLYLNKIFFGNRAYGVAAAAEFYYGKTLDQLTLPECAMLASLPKFPSSSNPLSNRARATERRNYTLQRMLDNGFITAAQFKQASAEPDQSFAHEPPIEVDAPYIAEQVRLAALDRLGNDALTDGYSIYTTLDSRDQTAANQAMRDDLIAYDERHGYRGPEAHFDLGAHPLPPDMDKRLDAFHPVFGLIPGIVVDSSEKSADIYLQDGQSVPLDLPAVRWAQRYKDESHRGAPPRRVDDVLKAGDVVRLARTADGKWKLSQIPKAQGALIALDPNDGAIEAEVGGFSYTRSKFNRAVQASRQPGSGFKPFFYSAAFEHGFTPASIINDAPIVFADPSKPNGLWEPKNDDDKFEGPMRLREALVESKNLVSVRLLDAIGVRYAREFATRFGFSLQQMPDNLSFALGTASVSPLAMARGYAVFANGGFLVDPYFIGRIVDRDGKEIYKAQPAQACRHCPQRLLEDARELAAANDKASTAQSLKTLLSATPAAPAAAAAADPNAPKLAPRVLDARTAYLIGSILHDVVRRGTGHDAMVLKRNDLAGKTGSTNDHRDAWFNGYNDDLVASVWVGFDDFSSLGRANGIGEFGAQAALPMWIDFMRTALKGIAEKPFEMPPGITTARIDKTTGQLAPASDPNSMLEVFKVEDVTRLASGPNNATEEEKKVQQDAYGIF